MKKILLMTAIAAMGLGGCDKRPEPLKIDNALTAEEIAAGRLTPEVMWKMSRAGSSSLSPDGKTLLYAQTDYNMAENRGVTTIRVEDMDSKTVTCLTDFTSNSLSPKWSADGRHIYFLSDRGGSMQVWRMNASGGDATQITGSGDGEGFPTMTIQIAHVNPTTDDDQYNKLATLFAEKVTAATDGAVTFEICGNSELGGEADVLTGFDLGTHQMGIITNGSYGNLYGPSLVVELPFIFKDNETAWNFLDGDIMKEVTDGLYDTLGYKVLAWGEGGFRNILSQKPIRTPADLKGMKIRVPGMEMFMATFQTIGAAPSALDFNETFTAVQQHLMDGLELPIASAYTGSYYEICDYYDMTGHFYNAISLSCSKSFWESLSPELQEIFLTAAKEAGAEQRTWLQTAAADMLSKMEDGGCTIIDDVDVAAFQEACAPVYEAYRDKIGSDLLDRAVAAVQ